MMKQHKWNANAHSAQNPFPAYICKPRFDACRSQRAVQRNKTQLGVHGTPSRFVFASAIFVNLHLTEDLRSCEICTPPGPCKPT